MLFQVYSPRVIVYIVCMNYVHIIKILKKCQNEKNIQELKEK